MKYRGKHYRWHVKDGDTTHDFESQGERNTFLRQCAPPARLVECFMTEDGKRQDEPCYHTRVGEE